MNKIGFINRMKRNISKAIVGKSNWFWGVILITILVDYLNSLFYDNTQNYFHSILESKNNNAMFFLIAIYVLLIIVIIFTGLMSSYKGVIRLSNKQEKKKKLMDFFIIIMIIGFGIILMIPSVNILGMGDTESQFSNDNQFTYMMVLLVFVFAIIILPIISFKPKFHLGDFNYFLVYTFIIIFASLLVDFSTAIWKFSFLSSGNVDPYRSSRILEFLIILPIYTMFFSAPRFILLRKSVSVFTLISTITSTFYFVWKSLEFLEF